MAMLSPLNVNDALFLEESWHKRPALWRSTRVPDVLTLAQSEEALQMGLLQVPFLRLARDGKTVPRDYYVHDTKVAHRTMRDIVMPSRVSDLLEAGATVVLDAAQRFFPQVAQTCLDLSAGIGFEVDANIYVTSPNAGGIQPHWDSQDVFLLQFGGSKSWSISEPVTSNLQHGGYVKGEELTPAMDETLHEGDVLYIPRGFVHHGTAGSDLSN